MEHGLEELLQMYASNASATSESMSITKKIAADNEQSKIEGNFAGGRYSKPLIFLPTQHCNLLA